MEDNMELYSLAVKLGMEMRGERPLIYGSDIIRDVEFYKWLTEQAKEGKKLGRYIDVIRNYMGSDRPFKDRPDHKAHKYVYQVWWSDHIRYVSGMEAE